MLGDTFNVGDKIIATQDIFPEKHEPNENFVHKGTIGIIKEIVKSYGHVELAYIEIEDINGRKFEKRLYIPSIANSIDSGPVVVECFTHYKQISKFEFITRMEK